MNLKEGNLIKLNKLSKEMEKRKKLMNIPSLLDEECMQVAYERKIRIVLMMCLELGLKKLVEEDISLLREYCIQSNVYMETIQNKEIPSITTRIKGNIPFTIEERKLIAAIAVNGLLKEEPKKEKVR